MHLQEAIWEEATYEDSCSVEAFEMDATITLRILSALSVAEISDLMQSHLFINSNVP